ncbi:acetyl/propionyl/methylcrotonyl-CoA carboxylase subunit alpha [Sphingomonas sp. TX0543]|uniref:acetyl/propionyl/methylcrotonyl-CoA carboxylase subunit alpha n=1 Tax=unclassified Sphingomonas TaxID=196159 RepID=UPI0010F80D84|nr:acetyl/propionyl/methylcrotonyl-CoA carboxylase subunit alpha [Sphingomonas sp. 3P27F8]
MIKSLLIANRGEIACRIIRTARAMGVRTVAVYSDADANALHVRQADEAVHIGPSPARESYLVGERIIAAARASGAEAIHPGYGFLSENADFAQAVIDAGLVWVGPKPASIRAMGLKDAAKRLMQEAGVPTTPGYLGDDQAPGRLRAEADAIGYPVLIKAVAGGGGKGMRRVERGEDFADALLSCQREAASSFGDDRVLLEKYILSPRHIEVQVFGDTHGNVVHLFERDCSLQRRHQKVIEEAPAPGMDEATRAAICGAAVQAARAVDYVGAGTIEFIADASEGLRADRIWFMEMNTRLQVEHPVTEEITAVDLVEWQLRVASGEPLPKRQEELSINGWAIEARLYAEDPAKGFLPSPGKLNHLRLDHRIRIESGVEEGDVVTPFYDPMIAKLVVHADTREEARLVLMAALDASYVAPTKTNAGFLYACLAHRDFAAGAVDTGLISRAGDALLPSPAPSPEAVDAAARRYRLDFLDWTEINYTPAGVRLAALFGFRLNSHTKESINLYYSGKHLVGSSKNYTRPHGICTTMTRDSEILVTERGETYLFSVTQRPNLSAAGAAADGAILSPMPGRIIAVEVAAGDTVAKGQKLVTLEAMKMEHSLVAPFDGTVAELNAAAGGQVSEGALLARIERGEG